MRKVQGNDSFQRINYLYQISKLISEKHSALSTYYGNLIVNIAKKNVLKIHPEVKRQMCKKCKCMLVADVTAKIKIKKRNNSKVMEWHCKICKTKKKLPIDKGKEYVLWLEKPEGIIEVVS